MLLISSYPYHCNAYSVPSVHNFLHIVRVFSLFFISADFVCVLFSNNLSRKPLRTYMPASPEFGHRKYDAYPTIPLPAVDLCTQNSRAMHAA